jgi:hypothetical protein
MIGWRWFGKNVGVGVGSFLRRLSLFESLVSQRQAESCRDIRSTWRSAAIDDCD